MTRGIRALVEFLVDRLVEVRTSLRRRLSRDHDLSKLHGTCSVEWMPRVWSIDAMAPSPSLSALQPNSIKACLLGGHEQSSLSCIVISLVACDCVYGLVIGGALQRILLIVDNLCLLKIIIRSTDLLSPSLLFIHSNEQMYVVGRKTILAMLRTDSLG